VGIESAIVDFTRARPALLRPGARSLDELRRAAGVMIDATPGAGAPRASGTLEAHYAPKAKLRMMSATMLSRALEVIGTEGVPGLALYSRSLRVAARHGLVVRAMPDDAGAAAHELFAVLRELDAAGAALIWVEEPPEDPAWDGVRDRLRRAAASA
jgi:L-threonylcarbamoyladenylate synthase